MMGFNRQADALVVIVVDDDDAVRNSLKFALEIEGFAVRLYRGGAELLRAEIADCACLVIDQNMPGLSGLETVRKLRDRKVAVPAILITGRPSAVLRASALRVGAAIVEKPLLGDDLAQSIRGATRH